MLRLKVLQGKQKIFKLMYRAKQMRQLLEVVLMRFKRLLIAIVDDLVLKRPVL